MTQRTAHAHSTSPAARRKPAQPPARTSASQHAARIEQVAQRAHGDDDREGSASVRAAADTMSAPCIAHRTGAASRADGAAKQAAASVAALPWLLTTSRNGAGKPRRAAARSAASALPCSCTGGGWGRGCRGGARRPHALPTHLSTRVPASRTMRQRCRHRPRTSHAASASRPRGARTAGMHASWRSADGGERHDCRSGTAARTWPCAPCNARTGHAPATRRRRHAARVAARAQAPPHAARTGAQASADGVPSRSPRLLAAAQAACSARRRGATARRRSSVAVARECRSRRRASCHAEAARRLARPPHVSGHAPPPPLPCSSCPSTQHACTPTSPRRRARGSVARHAVRVPAASAVGKQHCAWRTPRQADACTASAGRTASARVLQQHAVGAASPASSQARS
jgi:hypothetical protein